MDDNDVGQTVLIWACIILSHIAFLFINKFWGYFWIGVIVSSLLIEYILEKKTSQIHGDKNNG